MRYFLLIAILGLTACTPSVTDTDEATDINPELEALEVAAKAGDPKIQYELGNLYFTGEGAPLNKERGVELFLESAAQDYDNAEYTVAYLYDIGDTLPQDHVKAAQLFTNAALQGHEESQYRIALYYAEGVGVEKDLVKAAAYLRLVSALDTRAATLLQTIEDKMTNDEKKAAQEYYEYLYKTSEPNRLKNESLN